MIERAFYSFKIICPQLLHIKIFHTPRISRKDKSSLIISTPSSSIMKRFSCTSSFPSVSFYEKLTASCMLLFLRNDISQVSSHSIGKVEAWVYFRKSTSDVSCTLWHGIPPRNLAENTHLNTCDMNRFCDPKPTAIPNHAVNNTATWISSDEVSPSEPPVPSSWYPDWGKSESCKNDGGEPSYMKNDPLYTTNSKEECCDKVSIND